MTNAGNLKFWGITFALGVAALLLFIYGEAERTRDAAGELEAPSLFTAEPGCALAGEQARNRAFEAERAARARWERVPYAVSEGPSAVLHLSEAVQCFRTSGDRESRARVEHDLTVWKRDLERVYARSRLSLTLARRANDAHASAKEAKTLLALLVKAGPGADPYRAYLAGVERASRAALIERLRAAEEN